jgi:CBS-domain-containing membrane protein
MTRDWALIVGQLMSPPAITIGPDMTIAAAARMMNAHHVRRLPVVDTDACLLGRRDTFGTGTESAAAHQASVTP